MGKTMIKKKNKPRERANADIYIEPIIFLSDNAPKELEEVVSELISMRGIIRLCICLQPGKVIYDYQRWGRTEVSLEVKEIITLYKTIEHQVKNLKEEFMEHLVLRLEKTDLLLMASHRLLLFLHADRKAKLPIALIKAKRILKALQELC